MSANTNGNINSGKENGSKKKEQLDVERAVGEGMDTPPAGSSTPPPGSDRVNELRARAMKFWGELQEMMKSRPGRVIGVIAGVSFVAGVLIGRIGRRG